MEIIKSCVTKMDNQLTLLSTAITASVLAGHEILKIYKEPKDLTLFNENDFGNEHPEKAQHEYDIKLLPNLPRQLAGGLRGAIILAVAHNEFLKIDLKAHKNNRAVIYDVKGILEKEVTDGRL
jgi:UDP-N-acetyl-D-galactosamine dehydrogenase